MDLIVLFLAFFAGIITVFAPCVFTLLPAILGSATSGNRFKPYIVVGSATLSIFIFTILLRATSTIFMLPQSFWDIFSGSIILFLGITTILPELWDRISVKIGFSNKANESLQKSSEKEGYVGDILMGISLGPVFTSCSPVYFAILGTVFQDSFINGLIYILVYSLGLALMLLLIAIQGQALIDKLKWAVGPHSVFKRSIGIIFIIVGWSVLFGVHKDIQTYIVENFEFLSFASLEENLVNKYIRR